MSSDGDRVGVVGTGVIGTGVVQALAMAGMQVTAVDLTEDKLAACRRQVFDNLRAARVMGVTLAEPAAQILQRIECTTSLEGLRDASFVVENVTERWAVKRDVYAALDTQCRSDCIIAANTSAIPISHIAAAVSHPERIVGIHFMNPVPMKTTAEMIRGRQTSQATLQRAQALLQRLGKQAVVIEDGPGFVSNRVLMLTINEAIGVLQDGIADASKVDRIFRECFGHPMGPLETADLIGLDTILDTLQVLFEFTHDEKFRPCALLLDHVAAGQCGRKSTRGFYTYE